MTVPVSEALRWLADRIDPLVIGPFEDVEVLRDELVAVHTDNAELRRRLALQGEELLLAHAHHLECRSLSDRLTETEAQRNNALQALKVLQGCVRSTRGAPHASSTTRSLP